MDYMMVITSDIKSLVAAIDRGDDRDEVIQDLIIALHETCVAMPRTPQIIPTESHTYPLDHDGYAQAYDPVVEESAFLETWHQHGIVVGKAIATPEQCHNAITRIHQIFNDLSHGKMDLNQPETYAHMPKDANGTPLLSRGFLEIYHDYILGELRQNIRAYIHHVLIWGSPQIWTSFDRLGVKPPSHEDAKGLPLHVDQNPEIDPEFKTLQGVLALTDCPLERGTFYGVPGSRRHFHHYREMPDRKKQYVELDKTHPISDLLHAQAQPFPLRAGDMVSWDSRTTHANTTNTSNDIRMVFYMAAGPAREDLETAVAARLNVINTGQATSRIKSAEALLRASIKPRYNATSATAKIRQPENFNLLGQLLYGTKRYQDIIAPPAS